MTGTLQRMADTLCRVTGTLCKMAGTLRSEVVDNYRAIGVTLQNRPIFSISLHTGHIKVNYF